MTQCEDCGEDCKRRTRCPRCGKLVCRWCYHHIHKLFITEEDDTQDNITQDNVPKSNVELTAFRLGLGL